MSTPTKVFTKTFGCQMNTYDSSHMAGMLRSSDGRQASDFAGHPDHNRIVHFRGATELLNQFVDVRIIDAMSHTLRGELIRA